MKNTKKGFTLIELLVVIAIIGVLSAIGLVALTGARGKARDAKRVSDLRTYSLAFQSHYDTAQTYANACTADNSTTNSTACAVLASQLPAGSAPRDPSLGAAAGTACADAAGGGTANNNCCSIGEYAMGTETYTVTGMTGTTFAIASRLESGTGGIAAGPINITEAGIQTCTP